MGKVFVLNGLPLSGKTTFGEKIGEELRERGITFLHTSSINPIKNLLMPSTFWYEEFLNPDLKPSLERLKREVTGLDWDGKNKNDYWRKAMSDLKLKIMDEFPSLINGWVLRQSTKLEEPYVMFVDIREPKSILDFVTFFGNRSISRVKTVLIESNRSARSPNFSDESVFDMVYDFTIKNNGDLDLLKDTARKFVDKEILENSVKERRK